VYVTCRTRKRTLGTVEFALPDPVASSLRGPPRDEDVATRNEALGILNRLIRDGRVAAAMALERALRNDDAGEGDAFEEG